MCLVEVLQNVATYDILLQKLVLNGLSSLWEFPGDVTAQMAELKELDLRWNVLRHMKAKLLRAPPRLQKVYLSGKGPMDNSQECKTRKHRIKSRR